MLKANYNSLFDSDAPLMFHSINPFEGFQSPFSRDLIKMCPQVLEEYHNTYKYNNFNPGTILITKSGLTLIATLFCGLANSPNNKNNNYLSTPKALECVEELFKFCKQHKIKHIATCQEAISPIDAEWSIFLNILQNNCPEFLTIEICQDLENDRKTSSVRGGPIYKNKQHNTTL